MFNKFHLFFLKRRLDDAHQEFLELCETRRKMGYDINAMSATKGSELYNKGVILDVLITKFIHRKLIVDCQNPVDKYLGQKKK